MTEALITLPEGSIDREYPVMASDELQEAWHAYSGQEAIPALTRDLLGVMYTPAERPTAFVSLDLCEVVRHTCASLWALERPFDTPIDNIHGYGVGMDIVKGSGDVIRYVTALMNNDLVQPMQGLDQMAEMVRDWREKGAYVFANTSTLPGCEAATVKYLGERMLGCFDGIVFPRNHDNTGTMNKGIAARILIDSCMQDFEAPAEKSVPVVHVDDLSHHLSSFRREVGQLPYTDVVTYQPLYPSEFAPDAKSVHAATPLESFQMVDHMLAEKLAAA